jgi:RHS repeat-associated protein
MGRPVSMTDNLVDSYTGTSNVWAQNGQYDPAGHVTSLGLLNNAGSSLSPAYTTQTMAYNHNGQVTSMNWATGWGSSGLVYTYSGTHNNGQITQMTDNISGETVSYSYDALKRLISASSTPVSGSGTTAWTQAYGYDGFGNMISKTLNGGGNSAPVVDPTTNRLTSGYDANGNMLTGYGLTMTYDGRNRAASASQMGGTEYYGYAPDNKRIYRWNAAAGTEEFTLYGAQGERLGTFAWATPGSPQYGFVPTETNVWFGKKLINRWVVYGGVGPLAVMRDRLGTDRETGARYYPYGDEITSTANDAEKYGTYVRDSFTTLDYADQRYYASSYGRFNTADPYQASAGPKDPGSWNRYAYVEGDPVNSRDPGGLFALGPGEGCGNSLDGVDYDGDGFGCEDGGAPNSILTICAENPSLALENPDCDNMIFPTDGGGSVVVAGPFTQGSGASNYINVTNLSTTSVQALTVQNDLRWLQQAISQNPACDSWLQGSYAAISFMLNTPGSGATMVAVGVGNFPGGTNAIAGSAGSSLPLGMLITVASNGAFFQSGASPGFGLPSWVSAGSNAVQAEILLHELAHNLGAAGMQPDAQLPNGQPNVAAQTANNQAVMTNCGGVVALAAGRN